MLGVRPGYGRLAIQFTSNVLVLGMYWRALSVSTLGTLTQALPTCWQPSVSTSSETVRADESMS